MDLKSLAKIDLIKELGLENLPKEQQEKMFSDMGEIIQQRVMLRTIESLSDEDKEAFTKLIEEKKDQPEEVENFIKEKVPEADDILMEEVGRYKQEIMELMKGVKEQATGVAEGATSGAEEAGEGSEVIDESVGDEGAVKKSPNSTGGENKEETISKEA